jgi:lipopolysaccharide biosynthesis glycosyltransferase
VKNYKELNFDPRENYFNAGLQLINTGKWREEAITEKTIDAINKYRDFALLGDQYGLNISLYKKWHELDPLWNHFCCFKHPNPHLIHFYGRKPIYNTYNNHFRDVFYFYLNQTEWKNSKSIGEFNRYIKKIGNVLQKASLLFGNNRKSFN